MCVCVSVCVCGRAGVCVCECVSTSVLCNNAAVRPSMHVCCVCSTHVTPCVLFTFLVSPTNSTSFLIFYRIWRKRGHFRSFQPTNRPPCSRFSPCTSSRRPPPTRPLPPYICPCHHTRMPPLVCAFWDIPLFHPETITTSSWSTRSTCGEALRRQRRKYSAASTPTTRTTSPRLR